MINPLWIVTAVATLAIGIQTLRLATPQEALGQEKLAFTDFKRDLAEEPESHARGGRPVRPGDRSPQSQPRRRLDREREGEDGDSLCPK